jgi:phosphatidylinositol glycan class W
VFNLICEPALTQQANLPYVLWVAAYNTTFLFGYLLIEIFLFSTSGFPVPPLLEAINKNGLAVFLVANLLTGLVNVSMRTMYVGDRTAVLVLVAYSSLVCSIAWLGRGLRWKIG